MRNSKLMVVSLSVLLAGCLNSGDDTSTYHSAPAPAPVVVAPANPVAPPADCCCPEAGPAKPCPCPPPCSKSEAQNWHPKEGHLVSAGDHIMDLKRQKGALRPSHAEMVAYLQTHMKPPFVVNCHQAEVILQELGL